MVPAEDEQHDFRGVLVQEALDRVERLTQALRHCKTVRNPNVATIRDYPEIQESHTVAELVRDTHFLISGPVLY